MRKKNKKNKMVHFSNSHLWVLHILTKHLGDYKLSNRLLKSSTGEELLIIFELAKNILEGNIPISSVQKAKLRKYEKKLIFLSKSNKNVKTKVNILLGNKLFLEQLLLIGKEFVVNPHYNSQIEESEYE
jgi:hypothetical protein